MADFDFEKKRIEKNLEKIATSASRILAVAIAEQSAETREEIKVLDVALASARGALERLCRAREAEARAK